MTETLNHQAIAEAGLTDWRIVLGRLCTRLRTGNFVAGLNLVNQIGEAAESTNHHPDIDLRYTHVDITLVSHDVGRLTQRDVNLARTISALAAERGVAAAPEGRQGLEVALNSRDYARIKPFWRTVLGMQDHRRFDIDIEDGSGQLPALWFQATEDEAADRMRFHLDVHVAPEVAEARVAEALEAGGLLVTAEHAPGFWVLADAEGNSVCVCT